MTRFGRLRFREAVLLELPLGRAPPQGAVLETLATVRLPRPKAHGFDERTWLRRHGIHVVLHATAGSSSVTAAASAASPTGLRALARAVDRARAPRASGAGSSRGSCSATSRRSPTTCGSDFRASGLYHLLAVSGQNVALVAAGALALAWLIGLPRWVGQLAALGAIGGYVLAVGPQPSVVRAGVAGALASLAWLAARPRDRWYFLLLGALASCSRGTRTTCSTPASSSRSPRSRRSSSSCRACSSVLEGYPLPP